MNTPRIIITAGEPAGIGPDITIQAAQHAYAAELIIIADPALLQQRAKQIHLPLNLTCLDLNTPPEPHQPGDLKIIPIPVNVPVQAGKLNANNSSYVIETLKRAASLCLEKKADAIVTGPVHKEIINQAGVSFTGHTEFFAEQANVKQTIMLFVAYPALRVALATTHLPLAAVPTAITKEKLSLILQLLNDELMKRFHIASPRIMVTGLNPHAGEGGYLGHEEIDTIIPVITTLQKQGLNVIGPLPADTIFTHKQMEKADVILAMYHDQALPVVKYASFGHAVNVTLGLPFVRTSVDHGTALDMAGSGNADAGSMQAAISLALSLVQPSSTV